MSATPKSLTARDIMTSHVITLTPDTDIWHAIHILLNHRISGVPVVNEAGELVGILSEKDCLSLFTKPEHLQDTVVDHMSETVVSIPIAMDVKTIASIFLHNNYRRLPVLSGGKIEGMISRRDLLRCLAYMNRVP